MKYIEFICKQGLHPRAVLREAIIGVYEDCDGDTIVLIREGHSARLRLNVQGTYAEVLERIRLAQDDPLPRSVMETPKDNDLMRAGSKLQQIIKSIKLELNNFTSKEDLRTIMSSREVYDAVVEWDTAMGLATEA